MICDLILLMLTDCDVNQKSEPVWVLLIQSAVLTVKGGNVIKYGANKKVTISQYRLSQMLQIQSRHYWKVLWTTQLPHFGKTVAKLPNNAVNR